MRYLLITAFVLSGFNAFAKKRKPAQNQEKPTYSFDVNRQLTGRDIYSAVAEVGLKREGDGYEVYEAIIRCKPSGAKADANACVISRPAQDKSDF